MMGLLYAEENVTISEVVSIQYRSVTDGWTDGRTELLYQSLIPPPSRQIYDLSIMSLVYI